MDTLDKTGDDEIEWVSFSLTHVKYPKGDHFGHFLAFVSLMPFAIIVSFVTLILFKRELDTMLFFAGQGINELLNYILKNTIKQQRPEFHDIQTSCTNMKIHRPKTYGMPSQHSQFMSFFVVFGLLFILVKLKHKSCLLRILMTGCLISSLILVTYSRIYLMYHFWSQVLTGMLIGSLWGIVFFKILYTWIEAWFNFILETPISRYFEVTRFDSEEGDATKDKRKKQ